MRWWSYKPHSGIATVFDYAHYCYVILPRFPCYSSPRRSYHMISSAHPCASRLCPSIYAYHTISFTHLGVSHLHPSIPTSQYATPPPSGSYCVTFSTNRLILLEFNKISKMMYLSLSLISLCFLTLRLSKHFMFTGVNSPTVKFPLRMSSEWSNHDK